MRQCDGNGNPLSSWRFILTPYIKDTSGYDIESAWDSEVNSSFREIQSDTFDVKGVVWGRPNGEELRMVAIGVDGKTAMDSGKLLKELPGNTLLAISAPTNGMDWMQPSEVDLTRPLARDSTIGSVFRNHKK